MNQPPTWRPPRAADPQLRASDRERETVAQTLREQHTEGRLDTDELQGRLERCLQAKTVGELASLVADLPETSLAHEPPDRWRARLLWLAPLLVGLAAASAVTGRHLIWIVIPMLLASRFARSRHEGSTSA